MNRLTKYEPSKDSMFPYKIKSNEILELDVIHTLGRLEDLEEELGCPFETIIEATTKGIIDFEDKEHTVVFGGDCLYVTKNDKLLYGISLKNYRKSWWLKGEK